MGRPLTTTRPKAQLSAADSDSGEHDLGSLYRVLLEDAELVAFWIGHHEVIEPLLHALFPKNCRPVRDELSCPGANVTFTQGLCGMAATDAKALVDSAVAVSN